MTSRPSARAPRARSPWLVTGVRLAALCSALGCAPAASVVPLGLGPLAQAEQSAQAQADAEQRRRAPKKRAARAPVVESAAPADPVAKAEPGEAGGDADATAASPASPAPAAFEGMFAGDDIAVYRLTGFPEREERDDKAKIRIEKAAPGSVSIILVNSADGSDLCELAARVEGNAALLEPAQPCFSDGSEGSLEAVLSSGRVVLDGDRLKMDAEGTLSLSLPDQELEGELTYTFTGERQ